jgi:hypothetical protein
VEAHHPRAGMVAGQRAEPGEGPLGGVLVEPGHRGGHLGVEILRLAGERAVEGLPR